MKITIVAIVLLGLVCVVLAERHERRFHGRHLNRKHPVEEKLDAKLVPDELPQPVDHVSEAEEPKPVERIKRHIDLDLLRQIIEAHFKADAKLHKAKSDLKNLSKPAAVVEELLDDIPA